MALFINGQEVISTPHIHGIATFDNYLLGTAGEYISLGKDTADQTELYATSYMTFNVNATEVMVMQSARADFGVYFRFADGKGLETGMADDDYFVFRADDTGGALVEIGRCQGAAEPWFGIGKDSDVVKATYDDKLGFFSTTPIVKPLKTNFNNWAAATDVAGALAALGLVDSA